MVPIISLIGKQNIGKSTLFNTISKKNISLVSNIHGLTCDRQYSYVQYKKRKLMFVDTPGIYKKDFSNNSIEYQTKLAIQESHIILFIIDYSTYITDLDKEIFNIINKYKTIGKIYLILNKIDLYKKINEYYYLSFGIKSIFFVSGKYNKGITTLFDSIIKEFNNIDINNNIPTNYPYISIIGKPNAGKSTFINAIVKKNRLHISSQENTTKDAIYIDTLINEKNITFIDTPGIIKKKNINDKNYMFIQKSFYIINKSNYIIYIIDIIKGISRQDLKIIKYILFHEKSIIILFNKCDLLDKFSSQNIKKYMLEKLKNLSNKIYIFFVSLKKENININSIEKIIKMFFYLNNKKLKTSYINNIIHKAIKNNNIPKNHNKLPKILYSYIENKMPIKIVITGKYLYYLKENYKKYLKKILINKLEIKSKILFLSFISKK